MLEGVGGSFLKAPFRENLGSNFGFKNTRGCSVTTLLQCSELKYLRESSDKNVADLL